MTRSIHPLTKTDRIRILLATLPDAIEQTNIGEGRAELGSRCLTYGTLWRDGSYYELVQKLNHMQTLNRSVRYHTTGYYSLKLPRARKRMAELGLKWLTREMGDVFVPAELTENAGFLPSEARWAARPKRMAA